MEVIVNMDEKLQKLIHPLPEEVQKMPRNEVVCHYCGVSYLIHHEVKRLEEEIAHLKRQVQSQDVGFLASANSKLKSILDEMEEKNNSYVKEFEKLKSEMHQANSKQRNNIKDLQVKSQALERERDRLEKENKKLKETCKSDVENILELEQKSRASAEHIQCVMQELEASTASFELIKTQLAERKAKVNSLEEECEELRTEKTRLKATEVELRKEVMTKSENNEQLLKEQQNLLDELDRAEHEATVLKEKFQTALEKEKDAHQKQVDRLKEDADCRKKDYNILNVHLRNSQLEAANGRDKLKLAHRESQELRKRVSELKAELHGSMEQLDQLKMQKKASDIEVRNFRNENARFRKEMQEVLKCLEEAKQSDGNLKKSKEKLVKKNKDLELELYNIKIELESDKSRYTNLLVEKENLETKYRTETEILYERLQGSLQLTEVEKQAAETVWKKRWNQYRANMEEQMLSVDNQVEMARRQSLHSIVKEKRLLEENESLKRQLVEMKTNVLSLKEELDMTVRTHKSAVDIVEKELVEKLKAKGQEAQLHKEEITRLQETVQMECEEREGLESRLKAMQMQLEDSREQGDVVVTPVSRTPMTPSNPSVSKPGSAVVTKMSHSQSILSSSRSRASSPDFMEFTVGKGKQPRKSKVKAQAVLKPNFR